MRIAGEGRRPKGRRRFLYACRVKSPFLTFLYHRNNSFSISHSGKATCRNAFLRSKISKNGSKRRSISAVVSFWFMLGPACMAWLCEMQFALSNFSAKFDRNTVLTFVVSFCILKIELWGKKLQVGFSAINCSTFSTFSIIPDDSSSFILSSINCNFSGSLPNFLKFDSKIF